MDGTEVPNATEESIFFSFDTGLTDCLADSLEFRDRDPRQDKFHGELSVFSHGTGDTDCLVDGGD